MHSFPLLHLLILSTLPLSRCDCVPCRYGASTVVCPQAAGTPPENAMNDFTCLCARLSEFETVLASCFQNDDLPTVCDPNDRSERDRVRRECDKRIETSSPTAQEPKQPEEKTKTKTKTVLPEQSVTTAPPSTGGKKTTFVDSQSTYVVTFYTSSPLPLVSKSTSTLLADIPQSRTVLSAVPTQTSEGGDTDEDKDKQRTNTNVSTIIGATAGSVAGVLILGLVAVEARRWAKRRENRRVDDQVEEAVRGVIRNGDGSAELYREEVRAELPPEQKPVELE